VHDADPKLAANSPVGQSLQEEEPHDDEYVPASQLEQ
jgi:hypothetical protein